MNDATNKVRLNVLPSGNSKVEELRRALRSDPPASSPAPVESGPAKSIQQKLLEGRIIEALRTVYDPEIPVNIHDLGLIYAIDLDPRNRVTVRMTLTAPGCPVAGELVAEVEAKIGKLAEIAEAKVELVWDPPWDRSRMSEAARLELGM